jgi:inorganic pyrophosphatase
VKENRKEVNMLELSPKLKKKMTADQYKRWQEINEQYFNEVQILFEIYKINNKKLAGVIAHNLSFLAITKETI